jgi:hypothetical protein
VVEQIALEASPGVRRKPSPPEAPIFTSFAELFPPFKPAGHSPMGRTGEYSSGWEHSRRGRCPLGGGSS